LWERAVLLREPQASLEEQGEGSWQRASRRPAVPLSLSLLHKGNIA
jgi:hypothetical protein